jgi:hypothetical protein
MAGVSLWLVGALSVAVAADSLELPRSGTVSRTQRFVATRRPDGNTLQMIVWMEDVAEMVAEFIGQPLFFRKHEPVRVLFREEPDQPAGAVLAVQDFSEGLLQQRLVLVNETRLDQEDLLNAFVWLLMNRCVIERQSRAQRLAHRGAFPAWVGVGVAQNLYPVVRQRNDRSLYRAWLEGQDVNPLRLEAITMAADATGYEKALAGSMVAWMMSRPGGGQRLAQLADEYRDGERSPSWNWWQWLGFEDERAMVEAWDLWIGSRGQLISGRTQADRGDLDALDQALTLAPGMVVVLTGYELESAPTLEDLIHRRSEPWVPGVARFLLMQVETVGMGKPALFREVVERYAVFLRAVIEGVGGAKERWSEAALLRLLFEAQQAETVLRERLGNAEG